VSAPQTQDIAVERVPRQRIHQDGVIAVRPLGRTGHGNVYEITDLVEKPKAAEAPSDLANGGRPLT